MLPIRMRWIRSATITLAMLVATGCSNDEPMGHERNDGLLIMADGIEVSGHLPLNSGVTNRVEFRLLDANDDVITETDHLQLTVTWDPTDLATAVPVTGTTTSFDITTTKPADTDGFMNLSVYHTDTQETRTFPPFHVLVH